MKKSLFLAIIALMLVGFNSNAQFRWGIRAGMTVNELSFDKSTFHSSNRNGFTGGLTTEFKVPVLGLNFDASLMYTNRSFDYDVTDENGNVTSGHKTRGYINIPLNIKYMFNFPAISSIIAPFITTGPDFSFLVSKRNTFQAAKSRRFDTAWTLGAGVQLFRHLQVAANYGWGLNKTISGDNALYASKNRCWTITASYYF